MLQYVKSLIKLIIPHKLTRRMAIIRNKVKYALSEKKTQNISILKNSPMIYVLCKDSNSPCGGRKYLYKHVDVLNRNGFAAAILHQNFNFRLNWFENNTKVVCRDIVKFKPNDFLVIPEVYGPDLAELERGIKKVILNQSSYITFRNYSIDKNDLKSAYLDRDVVAVFCTSQLIYDSIKEVFPQINAFRAHVGIDSRLFKYNFNKGKRIAFMPRKLHADVLNVINILKFRGVLNDFEIEIIDNVNEKKVAEIFQRSLFFLSFSDREGLGLPPLEAMSCGCVVIGYDGIGGKEYFNDDFCFPIENTNVFAFAKTIENVIHEYDKNADFVLAKGKNASEYVNKEYSLEREEQDIVRFWKQLI